MWIEEDLRLGVNMHTFFGNLVWRISFERAYYYYFFSIEHFAKGHEPWVSFGSLGGTPGNLRAR